MIENPHHIVNEILLRMKYDCSKTLSENKKVILEQGGNFYDMFGNLVNNPGKNNSNAPANYVYPNTQNYPSKIPSNDTYAQEKLKSWNTKFSQFTNPNKITPPKEVINRQNKIKPIEPEYLSNIQNEYLKKMLPSLQKLSGTTLPTFLITSPRSGAESSLVKLGEKLGFNYLYISKYDDFVEACKLLEKLNIKIDELALGTHGSTLGLSFGLKDSEKGIERYYINSDIYIINPIKKIIIPSLSKIFLTACHAGDDLSVIKDMAEKLGVVVYTSAGNFYPLVNLSEGGFYSCSPEKTALVIEYDYAVKSIGDLQYEILVPEELIPQEKKSYSFTSKFQIKLDKSISGSEVKIEKDFEIGENQYHGNRYILINFNNIDEIQTVYVQKALKDLKTGEKIGEKMDKLINKDFDDNKIVVSYDGKEISRLAPQRPKSITQSNEDLLKTNACKYLGSKLPFDWLPGTNALK